MLRLELEAEVAELQAEAEFIVAEAEVEAREEGWTPPEEVAAADADQADTVAAIEPAGGEATETEATEATEAGPEGEDRPSA